jgi:hypothetical protein
MTGKYPTTINIKYFCAIFSVIIQESAYSILGPDKNEKVNFNPEEITT